MIITPVYYLNDSFQEIHIKAIINQKPLFQHNSRVSRLNSLSIFYLIAMFSRFLQVAKESASQMVEAASTALKEVASLSRIDILDCTHYSNCNR